MELATRLNDPRVPVRAADSVWQRFGVALVIGLLPLYPLVPRFPILGPLGTDDLIPIITIIGAGIAWVTHEPRYVWSLVREPRVLVLLSVGLLMAMTASLAGHDGSIAVPWLRTLGRLGVYA